MGLGVFYKNIKSDIWSIKRMKGISFLYQRCTFQLLFLLKSYSRYTYKIIFQYYIIYVDTIILSKVFTWQYPWSSYVAAVRTPQVQPLLILYVFELSALWCGPHPSPLDHELGCLVMFWKTITTFKLNIKIKEMKLFHFDIQLY